MKRIYLLFPLLLSAGIVAAEIRISDAWIPAAPPTASVMAGYMIIENTGDDDVRISSFSSPRFGLVEMHQTVIHNDMASMNQQEFLEIPAKGVLRLEPQARHLMLIHPHEPVQVGEEISFSATLDDGQSMTFTAVVRTPPLQ